jgi:fused signal recognition particle receptor
VVLSWVKNSWSKVRSVLRSTRSALTGRIKTLFGKRVDESLIEELEEILYEADLGVPTVQDLIKEIRSLLQEAPETTVEELLSSLEKKLVQEISHLSFDLSENSTGPTVILIVGANGSGKTTSIAKLSHGFLQQGKSVLLAAADTFRAAAQEQLAVWADRLKVPMIRSAYQADPAAVAFDAICAAKARGIDVLLIDTAGRLESRQNLLKELEKINRSCHKALGGAPHEVLLLLDATVGQNGIEQAKSFHAAAPITGLILTKIDGSAKGGVVMAIQKDLSLPVKFVGTGETIEDLSPFNPKEFVHLMFFDNEES